MKAEEIREGDIVEMDYITEFTKEHINEGKALVLWKGFNHQPLIMRLDTEYSPTWSCYEHISKVVSHIPLGNILKELTEIAEREKAINEWLVIHCRRCANNDDRGTEFVNCQAECEVQKDVGIACIHYEVAESEEQHEMPVSNKNNS